MQNHDRAISSRTAFLLRGLFSLGALYASLAVACQAAATHLPDTVFPVPNGRSMMHMAVDIALWHGIALCALTPASRYLHPQRLAFGCTGLALGTSLFSIPVTLHGFGILFPARLAPTGGTLLILSWLCVASAAFIRSPLKGS
ncbi:DUF423 domain-containing protein [Parasaccharibacter sp. TMW 2.1888]|uniref:DUF423 domain-containing protein n=1 Tax=Parasaccharibacter sp. TMW 2.1888 TaxID=2268025 RepID=UPI0020620F17|nr:DUF423 domain-containing protein [Parasaccharibacter sp. TMW 2.1888]UPO79182.1 DUF423 domain-containing protein [Parasaccharibacter sp. TMW 2.1888]